MRLQGFSIALLFILATASASWQGLKPRTVAPDNSRENVRFCRAHTTADDQPNDRQDRLTAAKIRRIIVADDTLSLYGHNVKIIVANGKVTLEGPVHSDDERAEIAFDAATIVAARSIVNKVSVV